MSKLNQKGMAHILVIFILLAGILAGAYLVQHPAIFKGKASGPSEGPEYNQWVNQMQSVGIYPAKDESGEITLYSRKAFTEKFCQPQGCYLNPIPFEEVVADIKNDAKFIRALGEKLHDNDYAPLEVLETYFPDITTFDEQVLGGALQALEPICRDVPEPEIACVPELKTNISEDDLRRLIGQVAEKEAFSEKDPIKNIINFAGEFSGVKSMLAVLGKPANQVTQDDQLHFILPALMMVFGPGGFAYKGAERMGAEMTVNEAQVVKDMATTTKALEAGEAVPLKTINQQAEGWINLSLGKKAVGLIVKRVDAMTAAERYDYNLVSPLLESGEAYILNPQISRPVLSKLLDGVESAYRSAGLPRINKKGILQTVDNNWVFVVKDEQYYKLYPNLQALQNTNAFTSDRLVIIREGAADQFSPDNLSDLAHEFVHVISSNNILARPGQIKKIGVYFNYDQNQADIYGATMSQIYELFTDEVVHIFGYREVYKLHYPNLSNAITDFVEALMRESRGLTRADFAVFALTGNDKQLMQKMIKNGITPDRFMSILNREIDGAKLVQIMRDYRIRRSGDKTWLIPIGLGGGAIFMGAFFAAEAHGEELSQDIRIVYETPDQDVDLTITNSQSENYLNCSYSQEDSNCSSKTTTCIGHTDDSQCSSKKPEECFNLVKCDYNAGKGSSCSCSQ